MKVVVYSYAPHWTLAGIRVVSEWGWRVRSIKPRGCFLDDHSTLRSVSFAP